jgi:ABC-type multidrug transport system ATPase subunit
MRKWLLSVTAALKLPQLATRVEPNRRSPLHSCTRNPHLGQPKHLELVGRLRGLRSSRLDERTAWVIEKCGLAGILGKRIRECSKGNRQRVGLAAALIHDTKVILLDEPTHGLAPLQVAAFQELLGDLLDAKGGNSCR